MSFNVQAGITLAEGVHQRVLAANPFTGWFGSANISWLDPMKKQINQLSGYVIGAIILVALFMIVIGAAMISTAGKSEQRERGAVRVITNAGKGIGVVVLGVPLAVLLIGAFIAIFG